MDDDREILRHLLFDYTKEEIDTDTNGTFINPIDQTLSSLRSHYKQKLLEKIPKEKREMGPHQLMGAVSSDTYDRDAVLFNQALSQFKQIIEEIFPIDKEA